MNVHHSLVDIVENIVDAPEEMDFNRDLLANAHGASDGLVDHGGIPVLGQKENALAEL